MITDRLDQIETRYKEIGKLMGDPSVATDIQKVTKLAKEYSSLEKTVLLYQNIKIC